MIKADISEIKRIKSFIKVLSFQSGNKKVLASFLKSYLSK